MRLERAMQALVADGDGGVRFAEVTEPAHDRGEVLVEVWAVSVNRGEAMDLAEAKPGARVGGDFAGVVLESGDPALPAGTRVLGVTRQGSWAQRITATAADLGAVPDEVSDAQAAALGLAALTARRLLARAGDLGAGRVLVTGASGGVGGFAVQLAAAQGAEVIAVSARGEHTRRLKSFGAAKIASAIELVEGQVDLVLESVGGDSLTAALELIAPGGLVLSFESSSEQPSRPGPFWFGGHDRARLEGFVIFSDLVRHPPGRDLSELAQLTATGRLDAQLSTHVGWERASELVRALLGRQFAGKAVLDVN